MSYKKFIFCLPFSLFIISLLFCRNVYSQLDFSSVDSILQQNKKALGNNLVALVWKDGKIVYQKVMEKEIGDFNAKTQIPINVSGNWLTAALVMTFVDQGKISLDDKVSKYIPIYATYMKSYITIRNCLTNSTGIQADAVGAMKILQKSKFETLEDEVNSFASKREIQTNPGTEFYFSHVGPNIAARVLEIISKKSFDRLIQERIFRPLKMRFTSFANDDGGAVNPSYGARSTANDYMNFLVMLLNHGVFEGKKILSEDAVKQMETAQLPDLPVKYTPKGTEGFHYGLGAWILESSGDSSTVLSAPNQEGVWPYINKCKKYAAVLFVKSPSGELRKEFFSSFKESIDAEFPGNCQ